MLKSRKYNPCIVIYYSILIKTSKLRRNNKYINEWHVYITGQHFHCDGFHYSFVNYLWYRYMNSFAAIKTKQKHNYFLNSMALFSFKSSSVCHVCWLVDCWYANFLQMFLTYRCKIVVVPTPLEVRCNFANNFAGYMVGKINGHNPKPGLTNLKKNI